MMYDINKIELCRLNYAGWLNYFKLNDKNRISIDKNLSETLSEEEKRLISSSINAFRDGEKSEGNYLRAFSERFAEIYAEKLFPEVINMFIKEENYHSFYLDVFIKREGINLKRKNYLDKFFIKLRRSGSLETEIITLFTAEIIALTYYDLLFKATNSVELKRICRQILDDEMAHIVFQSYNSAHFRQSKFLKLKRKILMEITTVFVYISFYYFFRNVSCTFRHLRSENMGYLRQTENIIIDIKNNL